MFLNAKNSKQQGNIGLSNAIAFFCECGYIVSIPLTDSQEYDLIVDMDGLLKTIQVKTTRCIAPSGNNIVELRTWTHCGIIGYGRKLLGNVDYVYVLTHLGIKYLIPRDDIVVKHSLVLGKKYSKYII